MLYQAERVDNMKAAEEIIRILGGMSLEELLELYRDTDKSDLAEASLLRLLITAELDKRIQK